MGNEQRLDEIWTWLNCKHEFVFDCVAVGQDRDRIDVKCAKCDKVVDTIHEKVSTRWLKVISHASDMP